MSLAIVSLGDPAQIHPGYARSLHIHVTLASLEHPENREKPLKNLAFPEETASCFLSTNLR